MASVVLNAVIDFDPVRAEATINTFREAWSATEARLRDGKAGPGGGGGGAPEDETRLKFVHFREVDDLAAVASGNNRFSLIIVAVGGLADAGASLGHLQEFEHTSTIVRLLNEDCFVDDTPPFLCKTLRFPLAEPAARALFNSIRDAASVNAPPLPPRISIPFHPPASFHSPTSVRTLKHVMTGTPYSAPQISPQREVVMKPDSLIDINTRAVGCPNRRKKARNVGSVLRNAAPKAAPAAVAKAAPKERDIAQGPKLWADIHNPGKAVLFYERSSSALFVKSVDETTSRNLEVTAGDIGAFRPLADFFGPATSQVTVQRLLASVQTGMSASFYLNLYSLASRTPLSMHVTTSVVRAGDAESFLAAPTVVVVFSLRSASVVGNAKLIGYSLGAQSIQTVKNSPVLKQNIIAAFGMY
jgi:hypothetical protein